MLILTRRISESVMIGDEITVSVLGVKGNQVRLGIAAPRNMDVDREEIRERKLGNPHEYVKLCSHTGCLSAPDYPSNYCSLHRVRLTP